jgi:hypothetical protein
MYFSSLFYFSGKVSAWSATMIAVLEPCRGRSAAAWVGGMNQTIRQDYSSSTTKIDNI